MLCIKVSRKRGGQTLGMHGLPFLQHLERGAMNYTPGRWRRCSRSNRQTPSIPLDFVHPFLLELDHALAEPRDAVDDCDSLPDGDRVSVLQRVSGGKGRGPG